MARTPRMMKIAGPLDPGTRIAKPPAYRPRPKADRFYNTDGYSPGEPFEIIVPDDPYHRKLVSEGAVMVVKRLKAADVLKMQATAKKEAEAAAKAFAESASKKAAANKKRQAAQREALKKALAEKMAKAKGKPDTDDATKGDKK